MSIQQFNASIPPRPLPGAPAKMHEDYLAKVSAVITDALPQGFYYVSHEQVYEYSRHLAKVTCSNGADADDPKAQPVTIAPEPNMFVKPLQLKAEDTVVKTETAVVTLPAEGGPAVVEPTTATPEATTAAVLVPVEVVPDATAKKKRGRKPAAEKTGDHAARIHHKYSMSKLNHKDDCSGFESSDEENEASKEGTMLHEVVEAILQAWLEEVTQGNHMTLVQAFEIALANDLKLPNGQPLEDGQKDAVRDVLKEIDWEIPSAAEIFIEEKLTIFNPDGTVFNNGHVDLIIGFADKTSTLMDYKFGRGRVRAADKNLQGQGYAFAFLQKYPEYDSVKVKFVQPRLSFVTESVVPRSMMVDIYNRIENVVARAEDPNKTLTAGDQCRYCAARFKCTALANFNAQIGSSYSELPVPKTFHGSQITDPTDMALALYWVKRAEPAIEGIKKAATQMAKEGFELTCVVGNKRVTFELGDKASPRQVGSAPLVFQAVKDVVTPEAFTACVDVRIGDLEKVYADAVVEKVKQSGERMTKKAATEQLCQILTSEGLLTRSDDRVSFLKESVVE